MEFVFKMMNFGRMEAVALGLDGIVAGLQVRNYDEFCIKNEELCIKNEELCIKNDKLCIKMIKTLQPGSVYVDHTTYTHKVIPATRGVSAEIRERLFWH